MSDDKAPPDARQETRPHRATSKGHRDARAEALEKALRDNLRRRKAAGNETPSASARRATESKPPSRSEALGQDTSPTLHEKGTENPEDGA